MFYWLSSEAKSFHTISTLWFWHECCQLYSTGSRYSLLKVSSHVCLAFEAASICSRHLKKTKKPLHFSIKCSPVWTRRHRWCLLTCKSSVYCCWSSCFISIQRTKQFCPGVIQYILKIYEKSFCHILKQWISDFEWKLFELYTTSIILTRWQSLLLTSSSFHFPSDVSTVTSC